MSFDSQNKMKSNKEELTQEEMLLQRSLERQQREGNQYIKAEEDRLLEDGQDQEKFKEQLERLKLMKNTFSRQNQEIKSLNKVVEDLKSQNKSLKLDNNSPEQSDRKHSLDHNFKSTGRQNPSTRHKCSKQRHNRVHQNIVNRQSMKNNNHSRLPSRDLYNLNDISLQPISQQRYMSPQIGKRMFSNSNSALETNLKRIIGAEGYSRGTTGATGYTLDSIQKSRRYTYSPLDSTQVSAALNEGSHLLLGRNHAQNKKAVITSFVDELKNQLEQNAAMIKNEKRAHHQTKQRLRECLEEMDRMRSRIQMQPDYEQILRENEQLKHQLRAQLSERLVIDDKIQAQQIALSSYEKGMIQYQDQFTRELDRMDEIYYNVEKTLKL